MKKCSNCDQVKPIEEFNNDKGSKHGKCYHCKICSSERNLKHRRSLKGKVMDIYSSQRHSSKKRGHNPPNYTKEEFFNWLINNEEYLRLYNEWTESGYENLKAPSCDRIDDYKGYSFDNIQLMTWGENKRKSFIDKKNGVNNKQNKAILKMSLEGEMLKTYYSMRQAAREMGVPASGIWKVCNGKRKQSHGFKWRYLAD